MSRRGAGFRRTSCRIIVIICGRAVVFSVGADHSARCFVIARALCLLQRSPSTPHRVRSVRGCLGCSSWSDVASDLVRRFSAGASGLPRVPTESGGWPGHFRRLLCFKSPFVGRRSIARVPGGNAGRVFFPVVRIIETRT